MLVARVLVRGVSSEYAEWIPELWLALLGSALLGAMFLGLISPLPERIRDQIEMYVIRHGWSETVSTARGLLGCLFLAVAALGFIPLLTFSCSAAVNSAG